MRAGLALRWARATLLATVAGSTGVLAHLSAGGLLPGAMGIACIFLMCGLWSASMLGRPASRRRVVFMVVACQTFTHLVLTAAVGHRGDRLTGAAATPPPPPAPVAAMSGGARGTWMDQVQAANPAAHAPVQLSVPAPLQHLLLDFTGPHALMAVAHVAAAALLGCWLARGEQMLWSLLSLSAQRAVSATRVLILTLRHPVALWSPTATRITQHADHRPTSRPVRWFTSATAGRGPPLIAGL